MAEEEKEEKTSKKKGGGSVVLIIVVLLFVLLLAVVGMIGFLMLQGPDDDPNAAAANAPAQNQQANRAKNGGGAGAGTTRGSDYANIGPMYPLESFTLNLLSDGGARYVKCTMQLEQNTDLLQAELDKKMAVIRDVIIRTLTSKTFEEVSTTKGKERLKDELVGKINEVLTDGFVKNIYFTDFVVQ